MQFSLSSCSTQSIVNKGEYTTVNKVNYLFRFETQQRANNFLNKVVKEFDEQVQFVDMSESSLEFEDAHYYFWDLNRDEDVDFAKEFNEVEFHRVISDLVKRYKQ